jgi:hypothetical protein
MYLRQWGFIYMLCLIIIFYKIHTSIPTSPHVILDPVVDLGNGLQLRLGLQLAQLAVHIFLQELPHDGLQGEDLELRCLQQVQDVHRALSKPQEGSPRDMF